MTGPPEAMRAALAGRHEMERGIGQGGMATVCLARDLRHHRQVAIEVLRPDLAASLGPDRFLREVGTAARLKKPERPAAARLRRGGRRPSLRDTLRRRGVPPARLDTRWDPIGNHPRFEALRAQYGS